MAGYLQYGYREISRAVEPQALVDAATALIENQVSEVRKVAQAEIRKSAPQWASRVSQRARNSIPELRAKLETFVMTRVETRGQQAAALTEARFREFIAQNRDSLKQAYADLAQNRAGAKIEVETLRLALDKSIGADMQARAFELLQTLHDLNRQLRDLKEGKNLDPEQQVQRRVLMVARRLQLNEADPALRAKAVSSQVNSSARTPN